MCTRSQSRNNFPQQEASPAIVEPLRIELPFLEDQFQEDPLKDPTEVSMADNRTMAELLQAPTEGYEDAIVIPEIAANNIELKHGLINLVQNKQFFGHDKEDPHAQIRYFNKITSTMRVPNVPSSSIKLILFPFSLEGATRIWLEKEPPRSILTWDDLVTKFINRFFPPLKTTNLRNEITRFQQRFDESFYEAWDRFNDMLRASPAPSPTPAPVKAVNQPPAHQAPIPQTQSVFKTDFESYVKANDAVLRNMQNQGQNLQIYIANLTDMMSKFVSSNTASSSGSGTLPSNTITNPKEDLKGITTRSGVAYRGPTIPTPSKVVKQRTEVTKDQVQTPSSQSTAPVQPPVVQSKTQTLVSEPVVAPVSAPMPNLKPSIPYPSRRDNERHRDQANEQIEIFYKIFKYMSFEISFTDALILMPKFAFTLKALIGNKEKLSEMARTSMNEHCLAVILNKLPRKLGDPGKFLIPCEFPGMDECLALADLGTSINLMPLSMWEGLSLSKLTSTCMTLELADRLVSKPIGIAKDVSVKVGVFHFPADFVVVDFEPDPRVHLILERCFLKTGRALIDVHKGELTLCIENEAITYNLDQTSRYSANYNQITANKIDVIHMACEEYSQEVPGFSDYMPSFKKELKVCEAKTVKSSVDEPFEVELKDLPPHLEYVFLEGDNNLPVIIAKELGDEEKSALIKVLKSHKQAIAWKLSDIQGINPEFYTHKILMEEDYKPAVQHQRLVNPKIYDVIKKEVEKLLDAGLIYLISDSPWVSPVHCVPKKGGFTVVENEENELILTRLVTRWRDAKARLLRWVLLLQEFDFKVLDTKGAENLAADHLSRLENQYENVLDPKEINETFPLETLSMLTFRDDSSALWFAEFANYHAVSFGPPSTRMPTSLLKTVTRANDKENFHNVMRCLKTPSKFVKSLTFGALTLWARSCLHEGTNIFSWPSIICQNGLKQKRSPPMTPELFASSLNLSSPDLVLLELS
nr:reverse transcriptase domain-containing protein [Tanacetum cinerariifolium]